MWPFKNKFNKLKREEVVDAIYELEKQEQALEDGILEKQEEIDFLLAKGKKEKSEELRLLYAKKNKSFEARNSKQCFKKLLFALQHKTLKPLKRSN